ncbi:hypothetical protein K504DRAFT_451654 [Pleomassaria siparia CBS 279.74]|uniref:S-adenosyl-L-methionine-dependent methyltransferase n=1 Tax=Pleomassaria siparia CBS 279.74 TaxID=1314801 RepID=A0A6G1JSI9_9PLEO|nr:hypothetical protein K504DRAFT_451654 [Pleomassaria siparia CBS 279.74]
MTQPTSVNMTFDTSLVDLNDNANANVSFSTTESDPSDSGLAKAYAHTMKMPTLQPAPLCEGANQETPKAPKPAGALSLATTSQARMHSLVEHIPTMEAYDQWASIYDSDGNMLQSIDDYEMKKLLPIFISKVLSTTSTDLPRLDVVDLGCGTARNTAKLITYPWPNTHKINIIALDFSANMIDVAANKIDSLPLNPEEYANPFTRLEQCDCFPTVSAPSTSPLPSVPNLEPVNGVLSTLVLEHIPLTDYFSTLACLLLKGGYALITNMHNEMGRNSQAGFINEVGVKVRGKSFAHTLVKTREEARRAGFEILEVRERSVERSDIEKGIVGNRGLKWIGVKQILNSFGPLFDPKPIILCPGCDQAVKISVVNNAAPNDASDKYDDL